MGFIISDKDKLFDIQVKMEKIGSCVEALNKDAIKLEMYREKLEAFYANNLDIHGPESIPTNLKLKITKSNLEKNIANCNNKISQGISGKDVIEGGKEVYFPGIKKMIENTSKEICALADTTKSTATKAMCEAHQQTLRNYTANVQEVIKNQFNINQESDKRIQKLSNHTSEPVL